MPSQHGITSKTENRMVFDAGAMYRDYGEAGEELIGATRGGAVFTVERDDREIEVDGAMGPIKGMRRTIRHVAKLEVSFLEMSEQSFLDFLRGTSVSDGTHRTITPDNEIIAGDFYTNVALVAEVSNNSTPCILKLLEALAENGFDITTDDQNEGVLAVTFSGHYTTADLDTPPYQILWPVGAS